MGKTIQLSKEQIKLVIEKYKDNWTQKAIGELIGVSRSVIKRVLLENGIDLRATTKKYSSDDDIFEIIDTAEKAYWLGFIAADGCNYTRKHNASLVINIHQKDREHLIKFQEFMNTTAIIQDYIAFEGYSNQTPMSKIVINSKKLSQDLSDKGIVPNKSLVLKPPKISVEFYKPYILGYFDGDGSIGKSSQYNNYLFSIQGTRETLNWINEVLNTDMKLEQRTKNSSKNSYYIRCGGTNKPYNILKSLYNSSKIHLDRKYEIYKTLETVVLNRNI